MVNGSNQFFVWHYGSDASYTASAPFTDGSWHYLVYTYNGTSDVPEIGAGGMGSALTVLTGGILTLWGRRRRRWGNEKGGILLFLSEKE